MDCRKLLLVVILLLVIGCSSDKKPAQDNESNRLAAYSSISLKSDGEFYSNRYVIETNGETNILGDVIESLKFCPPDSPFICVHGQVYSFAVPRRDLVVGDKWTFDGQNYEIVPAYMEIIPGGRVPHSEHVDWHFDVLNNKVVVSAIRVMNNHAVPGCIDIYLFSKDHGLMGYTGRCEGAEFNASWTYWLDGTDGIGSPAFEKNISPAALMTHEEAAALYSH